MTEYPFKTVSFVLIGWLFILFLGCSPPTASQIKEWEELKQADSLIRSLKYPQLRWRVAESLGIIGDSKAVEPLIALLTDEDSLTRFHAVQALGRIKNEAAIEPLIPLLLDEHSTIRSAVAGIIENFGKFSAFPLAKALQNNNQALHPPVKEILTKLGDTAYYPLSLVLEGNDKNSKLIAIAAFRILKPVEAISYLKKSLTDPDTDISAQAAAALAEIKGFQARAISTSGENMGEDAILYSLTEEETTIESEDEQGQETGND
ncbi:MAG: HEAT repeat domain-containing protein [Candidatus Schekmanbacteria bacterium]|nr:HEAT repeat domain-containing protein [Candidatus Schekmanbacteria bacterium]